MRIWKKAQMFNNIWMMKESVIHTQHSTIYLQETEWSYTIGSNLDVIVDYYTKQIRPEAEV